MNFVTDSGLPNSPLQFGGERIELSDALPEGIDKENGGSGICDGGGVVVLCPADPMQHDVKGLRWEETCNKFQYRCNLTLFRESTKA